MNLQAVLLQQPQQVREIAPVALIARHDEGVGGLGPALVQGVVALLPEVDEQRVAVAGGQLQRGQHAGLHVVRIVAEAPGELLLRRPRPVPLPRVEPLLGVGGVLQVAGERAGVAVAEGLVEAADRVVVVGHPQQVPRVPAGVKAPRPYAAEAQPRRLADVRGAQPLPFGDRDRVDRVVVGAGAHRRVQQRHRLVQVQRDGRQELVVGVGVVARQRLAELQAVAVVVVGGVVAPVRGHRRRAFLQVGDVGQEPLVPVDHAGAPVHFQDRRDEGQDVGADLPDVLLLADGEAIGELHHHLRRAGLRRVQSRGQPVRRGNRSGKTQRRLAVGASRVGERAVGRLDLVQPRQHGRVGDRGDDHLPAAVRAAHREDHDPVRRLREPAEVVVDGVGRREVPGRADGVAQHVSRGRDRLGLRHVVDPRRQVRRIGRGLADRTSAHHVDDVGAAACLDVLTLDCGSSSCNGPHRQHRLHSHWRSPSQ